MKEAVPSHQLLAARRIGHKPRPDPRSGIPDREAPEGTLFLSGSTLAAFAGSQVSWCFRSIVEDITDSQSIRIDHNLRSVNIS
jgi:hypothetical protein